MSNIGNKLVIGTVQFGMNYGINNRVGQTSMDEVQQILDFGENCGITMLDTAVGYGDSEKRLGLVGVKQWKVITKIPKVPDDCVEVDKWVRETIEQSLEFLKISQLYAVLFHTPSQLLGPNGKQLYDSVNQMKSDGIIQNIGISIYSPEELDLILPKFSFDIVQAPFNLIDRRISTSGWLKKLHDMGVEIHVRSVFLQGLLLMQKDQRPSYFDTWNTLWREYDKWLNNTGISPLAACLNHVLHFSEISKLIVGVDSLQNLTEIVNAVHQTVPSLPETLISNDLGLINPSFWPKI